MLGLIVVERNKANSLQSTVTELSVPLDLERAKMEHANYILILRMWHMATTL